MSYVDNFALNEGQYIIYWIFTGGLTSILLLIKCIHGVRFLWFSSKMNFLGIKLKQRKILYNVPSG